MAEGASPAVGDDPVKSDADPKSGTAEPKKQRRGILSRMWYAIFGSRSEDFEKTLKHLFKEEASVHERMKKRAQWGRKAARNIIVLGVIWEVVAVTYAIMETRSSDLNWKMRALRVSPMFLLPAFFFVLYSTFVSFRRMRDHKDQKTLERLRAERQAKINELKERTNYYSTQQLIQRYDSDPAAKAAAASVLASKLGADSGLKVYLGDESKSNAPLGKSNDVELVQSDGLRNRKQSSHTRRNSTGSSGMPQFVDESHNNELGSDGQESPVQNQRVVEHYRGSGPNDGGWIARIAALLVGEDPTQSYALICGNCHMHNGLTRKEEFPYITYYCPHCHALNVSRQSEEHESSNLPASDDGSHVRSMSNPSSVTGSEITSHLTTVQELPVGVSDEKETGVQAR